MDSKDAIITELRRLVAGLERQLQWQAERISELELQLAKAKKDSSTSSKPPSSDIVKPPAKKKTGGRPELSSQPIFGPRMLAMVGWLKSKAHCSYTTIEYSTDPSQPLQTYDLSQDYFRFLFAAEIEPTNNHSEQQIRHCVIDRRITQGTRGEAGQRYHERMWTAIATCGKQNRSFFHFLRQSIAANLNNQPAPSLLTS